MVDTEGSIAIASTCTRKNGQREENRKVDLVVGELRGGWFAGDKVVWL